MNLSRLLFILLCALYLSTACRGSRELPQQQIQQPPKIAAASTTTNVGDSNSAATSEALSGVQSTPVQTSLDMPVVQYEGVGKLAATGSSTENDQSPAIAARNKIIQKALEQAFPVILLPADSLTEDSSKAQTLAMQDANFLRFVRQGQAATPLRNEIMGVRPALPSDFDQIASQNRGQTTTDNDCTPERCYRVEMYNYAYNLTTMAIVDITSGVVLQVASYQNTQPDIPDHLTKLSVEIAINAPEVAEALGFEPGEGAAVMPNIKTALNSTRCERSRHLCVAPTFLVEDRALWAIVDLTDQQLVGVRWTELGTNSAAPLATEESLQNEVISERYCEQANTLERNGWRIEYMLTSSDGLRVSDVRFDGRQVLRSAKLVDWHVSYSQKDGFGYSDAIGCPIFSSAAVIAYNGPQIQEIEVDGSVVGFAIIQDFLGDGWPQPCHYRYEQRYEFYKDGRFRVGGANHGRGCGTDGTYRPILRIDVSAGGDGSSDMFAEWHETASQEGEWQQWTQEQWQLQTAETSYTEEGYQYRIAGDDGQGFYIEPGNGQFGDGGRGDNAYLYVTKRHAELDEGDADLITIGSCCNRDHRQGPEVFMQPNEQFEQGDDLVLWYVAQLPNEDTRGNEYCWADAIIEDGVVVNKSYPCAFGPMFVPMQIGK